MNLSGERFDPSMSGAIAVEHLHRYAIIGEVVKDRNVLDIASGEGYGTYHIAKKARSVIGVDIAEDVIAKAKVKYIRDNLEFRVGSCFDIPVESRSVDVVVSFETIEHLDRHQEMIEEIHRVLTRDGVLVISSPDKLNYSDLRKYKNPHHVKELYRSELVDLLQKYFGHVEIYGQRAVAGSAIVKQDDANSCSMFRALQDDGSGAFLPYYNIALCSHTEACSLPSGIFEAAAEPSFILDSFARFPADRKNYEEQIRYRDSLIAELEAQLAGEKKNAAAQIGYRDELIAELEAKLASRS